MKRLLALGLVFALGLPLIACGGSDGSVQSDSSFLDKTFTMANGTLTFGVSSSWDVQEGLMDGSVEEYVFETTSMAISVAYYADYTSQPYVHFATIPDLYRQEYSVTNFQDISQKEISLRNIPGATTTVYKFSYTDPNYGDMIENIIHINRDGSSIIIFYSALSSVYDESRLNEFLDSINWS